MKKVKYLYKQLLDYLIFKSLKNRFRKYLKSYPIMSGRLFDVGSLKIMLNGRFENYELISLKNNVFNKINSKNSNALDIGANIGNHSLFFSDHFLNVYSFEPSEINFELLKLNIKSKANIKAFKYGASSKDQKIVLYTLSNSDSGHSSVMYSENSNINFDNKETIDLVNLDNFLNKNNISNVKFIKIDVEGYEFEVFKGIQELIKKDKPIIAFEQLINGLKNHTSDSINFLKKNNYNYFYETDFVNRKKYRFKIFYIFSSLIHIFKVILIRNYNQTYKIKKINNFEIKDYPMIIASPEDLQK